MPWVKRLDAKWRSLAEQTLSDPTISTAQRMTARRYFYAGAASYGMIMAEELDPGDKMTDADEQVMIDLEKEITEFQADLKASRA